MFDQCKREHRSLVTTSYTLLLRKDCPAGAYLLDPKSQSYLMEQALPRLLRTHGVQLSPCTFLTRCVVCNGSINRVHTDAEKRAVFEDHGAPNLMDSKEVLDVFRCDGCKQGYWWGDSPTSSASRVFSQATKLLRLCLRGGVRLKDETTDEQKRKSLMGAFDFLDVEKERQSAASTVGERDKEYRVVEWLREEKLSNPFDLKSAYAAQGDTARETLPFTNVTQEFVGCLDYIFFESSHFDQIGRLNVPTSFRDMNPSGERQGHLLPSDIWPSDHLPVGARLRLKQSTVTDGVPSRHRIDDVPKAHAARNTKERNANKGSGDITKLPAHSPKCSCGCVPQIRSLFEMAELRKQAREKKKAESDALRATNLTSSY